MKLPLAALAVLTFAAAAPLAAQAGPQVQAAWSRPAAKGTTGAGFMTLVNPDAKPDALIGVTTPVAREVQVHQSMMHDGMAMMQAAPRVAIPARGSVTFGPGGYHLMFLELNRPLNVGDKVPATLTFASGAKANATFVVGLTPPAAAPAKR